VSGPHALAIDRNTWVDRPAHQVFQVATDWRSVPRYGSGITSVQAMAPGAATWRLRWPGLPRTLEMRVTRREPSRFVGLASADGALRLEMSFVAVNGDTTAVTVHGRWRVDAMGRYVRVRMSMPDRRVDRSLARLKRLVESQPRVPERVVPGGRERPPDTEPATAPSVGVPRELGYQSPSRHAGSPGGGGSMGASSDDPDTGGWAGPAGIAGLPDPPDED
jgi:hypothetical protein